MVERTGGGQGSRVARGPIAERYRDASLQGNARVKRPTPSAKSGAPGGSVDTHQTDRLVPSSTWRTRSPGDRRTVRDSSARRNSRTPSSPPATPNADCGPSVRRRGALLRVDGSTDEPWRVGSAVLSGRPNQGPSPDRPRGRRVAVPTGHSASNIARISSRLIGSAAPVSRRCSVAATSIHAPRLSPG